MATKTREISDFLVEGGADLAIVGEPHIKPGTLYPAMRHFREITNNSGSAIIGDMTTNGGTASAFDGHKYSHWNASARKDPCANAFIGKDWGSGNSNIVTRFKIWAPYNYPLAGNTASRYMKLQGSNDNSSWTDLYEDPEVLDNYTILDVSTGITITTAYRYHRIFFEGDGNGGAVAELEFYTEDNPGRVYLADKETAHSGAYGTAQSDGKKYYYTEIEGSKPIKDPRIGANFGSQRHKFKSLQLLEQETATHGQDVFSIDGREWLRAVSGTRDNGTWRSDYTGNGNPMDTGLSSHCTGAFIEFTGYFNDFNIISITATNGCDDIDVTVNGTLTIDGSTTLGGDATVASPLNGRFVDSGSVINAGLSGALGINTVKFEAKSGYSEYLYLYGIELIAQDTTSTATKSQIQIPSQNVVSYGKKFTVSGTPHYNPFAFKTDGTTAWTAGNHNGTAWPVGTGSSANIDTATSLGLDAWVSTNYYKPYNGGRVVWWIDSSGTLKCSVNMMPPNARNISSTASNEKGDDSAGTTSAAVANNQPLPTFTDIAIDHSQAEIAKTFHFREFGNGGANAGTLGGSYADASMLNAVDDIAYVMDDGLTSLACDDVNGNSAARCLQAESNADFFYITFIGTGISMDCAQDTVGIFNFAQNLPYGTHILKVLRDSTHKVYLDGVEISSGTLYSPMEITFHQPKMPPIPENAVVLADYMLMADFVPNATAGIQYISKGVRRCSSSRDHFYDGGSAALAMEPGDNVNSGFKQTQSSSSTTLIRNIGFGINFVRWTYGQTARSQSWYVNDTAHSSADAKTGVGSAWGSFADLDANITLGNNILDTYGATADGNSVIHSATDIASPIHTSSHYQSFETPYLHELVGGDRNMEQNNLVVTADGKTWDEVTRDVSYLGNMCLHTSSGNTSTDGNTTINIMTKWRGHDISARKPHHRFNKDFAIAYDRMICLKDGQYQIKSQTRTTDSDGQTGGISINGTVVLYGLSSSSAETCTNIVTVNLVRGDYIQIIGNWNSDGLYSSFEIIRVN